MKRGIYVIVLLSVFSILVISLLGFGAFTGFATKQILYNVTCVYSGTTIQGPNFNQTDSFSYANLDLYNSRTGRYTHVKSYADSCTKRKINKVYQNFTKEAYCIQRTLKTGERRDHIAYKTYRYYSPCDDGCVKGACILDVSIETFCNDSDGGLVPDVFGFTNFKRGSFELKHDDACALVSDYNEIGVPSGWQSAVSCLGVDCYVEEAYCRVDENGTYIDADADKLVKCDDGCENGACRVPICTFKDCSELGKQCGTWDGGCGGTLECGSCSSSSQTCNANGKCVMVGSPNLGDEIVVNTDNNQYAYVTFTSARAGSAGEQKLTYVYDNDTSSTGVKPLLASHIVTSNNKGRIHVLEGEFANEGDWIVIDQADAGTILEVTDISDDGWGGSVVSFQDVITGIEQRVSLLGSPSGPQKIGVNFFGGNGYNIKVDPRTNTSVSITWNSNGVELFPRIKLKDGGYLVFLTETKNPNRPVIFPSTRPYQQPLSTVMITGPGTYVDKVNGLSWIVSVGKEGLVVDGLAKPDCKFANLNNGPAILFIEPNGDALCMPMTRVGTTELGIGDPTPGFGTLGWITSDIDSYSKSANDTYGAVIIKEDRQFENGVVRIDYA